MTFVKELSKDFDDNRDSWENINIAAYLEALAAWADGDVIFLYFQASSGFLCEATLTPGQPQVAYTITNLRAADIKLYTPLAATFGKNTEERVSKTAGQNIRRIWTD